MSGTLIVVIIILTVINKTKSKSRAIVYKCYFRTTWNYCTVHKVEQADNIVRVKYTINNTTNQTISGAPGAKIEQNGKSTIPSDFKGNWDQKGYIAPHTSVDGTNLYTLDNMTNEFDFKIRPDFEDVKNNPLVERILF